VSSPVLTPDEQAQAVDAIASATSFDPGAVALADLLGHLCARADEAAAHMAAVAPLVAAGASLVEEAGNNPMALLGALMRR
jgi:hypothetical protein